jgi:hypothetical protein
MRNILTYDLLLRGTVLIIAYCRREEVHGIKAPSLLLLYHIAIRFGVIAYSDDSTSIDSIHSDGRAGSRLYIFRIGKHECR